MQGNSHPGAASQPDAPEDILGWAIEAGALVPVPSLWGADSPTDDQRLACLVRSLHHEIIPPLV